MLGDLFETLGIELKQFDQLIQTFDVLNDLSASVLIFIYKALLPIIVNQSYNLFRVRIQKEDKFTKMGTSPFITQLIHWTWESKNLNQASLHHKIQMQFPFPS